ncbi:MULTISPECIES: N-acetylmuramoyl-L-alanine amidase [Streptacidiphilus]|uniref:N-acetylmuramoyl-L-alanine amidase n=1 Tax=Streptacidiphilus cavernicola TaxID=3342716 RepID=A0ABV6UFL7_9ACTN|nr:N-acetylmuramoyl-L-alanine amidase [Streptacidiphilus jeojiense]
MRSEHPLDRYDVPEQRRRRGRAATTAVVLAALVPLGFAGWLGWKAVAGPQDSGHSVAVGGGPGPGLATVDAGAQPGGSSSPAAGSGNAGVSSSHPTATRSPASKSTSAASSASASSSAAGKAPAVSAGHPLAGKTVVIDPGHNPDNGRYATEINKLVQIGNGTTNCDTTGTETNAGYLEADFTLDVARRARTLLEAEGAKVVFTQDGDRAWGPCVTERAAIGNAAHADAAISIHGDGAGASDHGFHVILPAAVDEGAADNRAIVAPSRSLGLDVRSAFHSVTGEPFANYISDGSGLDVRSDLGGLNLSTVPKVFIECGNMRNATDAKEMTSASWRQLAAQGVVNGITTFLKSGN